VEPLITYLWGSDLLFFASRKKKNPYCKVFAKNGEERFQYHPAVK
jgi:hypothetical protein